MINKTQINCSTIIAAVKRKNVTAGRLGNERKCLRDGGGKNPVGETAQGLAPSANAVRKNLADEHPDHRALTEGMRRDEDEQADEHDPAARLTDLSHQLARVVHHQ